MKTENPSSQLKCKIEILRDKTWPFKVKTNFILFRKLKVLTKLFFIFVETNLASHFSFQLTQNSFHNNEKSLLWLEKTYQDISTNFKLPTHGMTMECTSQLIPCNIAESKVNGQEVAGCFFFISRVPSGGYCLHSSRTFARTSKRENLAF